MVTRKFEYKTVLVNTKRIMNKRFDTAKLDEVINTYARDGWELWQVCPTVPGWNVEFCILVVFRR